MPVAEGNGTMIEEYRFKFEEGDIEKLEQFMTDRSAMSRKSLAEKYDIEVTRISEVMRVFRRIGIHVEDLRYRHVKYRNL
jgi:hypothetical protein